MKNLFPLALVAVMALTGCAECDDYHVEYNDECTAWAARIAGTWSGTGTCTNGNTLNGELLLAQGAGPNTLRLDNQLDATMTSENAFAGGPWTVTDASGTYTIRVHGLYRPARNENTMQNGVIMGTTTVPEQLTYTIYRNEGAANSLTCTVTMER